MMADTALQVEIATYDAMKDDLEAHHKDKWVVFHDDEFIGAFDTFDTAAAEAVRRFGVGPYLIRQVGAPPLTLPASVMYRPEHAAE